LNGYPTELTSLLGQVVVSSDADPHLTAVEHSSTSATRERGSMSTGSGLRGSEMPTRRRPREHYVCEALHKLDEHRFAVPVVTPRFAPAPERSTDW
jgi:hypothetical protein